MLHKSKHVLEEKKSSSLLQSDVWSDAVCVCRGGGEGLLTLQIFQIFVALWSIRIRMGDNLFVVEVICLQYVVILN